MSCLQHKSGGFETRMTVGQDTSFSVYPLPVEHDHCKLSADEVNGNSSTLT